MSTVSDTKKSVTFYRPWAEPTGDRTYEAIHVTQGSITQCSQCIAGRPKNRDIVSVVSYVRSKTDDMKKDTLASLDDQNYYVVSQTSMCAMHMSMFYRPSEIKSVVAGIDPTIQNTGTTAAFSGYVPAIIHIIIAVIMFFLGNRGYANIPPI